MKAPLKIDGGETFILRAHYDQVAYDTLRVVWHRKFLIASIIVVSLLGASFALALIGPRYTGEAIIQLSFSREESTSADAKIQPIAPMEAVALVDSAARILRSRATASAVVYRLGLDKNPDFARESIAWQALLALRGALGLEGVSSSPRDLAVNALMKKVTVTTEPRSYLISITITTKNPDQAAMLANAVALEYLRGKSLQQLTEVLAIAERELAQLSSVYGVRHPSYIVGRTKLEALRAQAKALRDGAGEDAARMSGQSFVPAEKVMVPSGPNIVLILGLTAGAALVAGIWLALLFRPNKLTRVHSLAIASEPPRRAVR
jgi:uncharacterized protein involved in exopolysaccharide biosynthesis